MKYFYLIFTFLVSGIFVGPLSGQEIIRCATTEYQQSLENRSPTYKKAIERMERILSEKAERFRTAATPVNTIIIPVVVHVLYYNQTSNISDDRIHSQIKIINDDYTRLNADTINTPAIFRPVAGKANFRFALANRDPEGNFTSGIIRKQVPQKSFLVDNSTDDIALKAISRWPTDQYLNIWVTTLSNNQNNKVLGYTFNPGTYSIPDLYNDVDSTLDGVVVDYTTFGKVNNTSKYNLGRTVTHEIGHWLGLRHIWGDNYCGNDYVNDTPLQENSNLDIDRNTCSHSSSCNGITTLDMSDNYMDYSPDRCMNIFTKGQVQRMLAVMQTNERRVRIQKSKGYCDLAEAKIPYYESFETHPLISWVIKNNSNDHAVTYHASGGFGQSASSLVFKNNSSNAGRAYQIESSPLNFIDVSDPVLEFSLAYSPGINNTSDSLFLSYSPDCITNYTLKVFTIDELTTVSAKTDFEPQENEWKKFRISLGSLKGKIANILFDVKSNGVNKLYLDDINVFDSKNTTDLLVYPNPVADVLQVELTGKEPMPVSFIIYDSQGKLVGNYHSEDQSFRKQIQVNSFRPGLYFIKAEVSGKTMVKKFLVMK